MPFVERVIPVLAVKSLKRSTEFYTGLLGFQAEWGGEKDSTLCSVARDGQSIMLSEAKDGIAKSCVWIGLENDSLFAIRGNPAVKVVLQPRNMPWAYEMKIEDPDGNILWFGTEPKA